MLDGHEGVDMRHGASLGSADRLDFTVSLAVSLAARLEQLTRRVGTRLVLSKEFVRAPTDTAVPLAEFALKGISKGQPVFGLPQLEGSHGQFRKRLSRDAASTRGNIASPGVASNGHR
jgi:class 3 adenylate cyclase